MSHMMASLRENAPADLGGIAVERVVDYSNGAEMPVVNPTDSIQMLPPADVFEIRLVDGSRVLFRPSGTEPKAKAYVFAKGVDRGQAGRKLLAFVASAKKILEGAAE